MKTSLVTKQSLDSTIDQILHHLASHFLLDLPATFGELELEPPATFGELELEPC